jgi:hypothetical protein
MKDFSFRTLFYELEVAPHLRTFAPEIWANDAYRDVLMPYLDDTLRAMEPLRAYGDIEARHWRKRKTGLAYDDPHQVNLWHLYALSRVSDLLLAPFTPVGDTAQFSPFNETWEVLSLRVEERTAWFQALGMHPIEASSFHPFYHEVVSVEQSPDPTEPITLVETIWPGFMLGQMLFCRAGVKVRGGSQHITKRIAETSTLYWSYRRNNRSTDDLSHGWGSNSQWGTDFRRDYDSGLTFYYNVDGGVPVDEPHPDHMDNPPAVPLSREERIELLTHRCFIVRDKPHTDLWPFDDTYDEAKPDQWWLRE